MTDLIAIGTRYAFDLVSGSRISGTVSDYRVDEHGQPLAVQLTGGTWINWKNVLCWTDAVERPQPPAPAPEYTR